MDKENFKELKKSVKEADKIIKQSTVNEDIVRNVESSSAIEGIQISKQMRIDQIKALDVYADAMRTDDSMKQFLENLKDRVERILDGQSNKG